MAVQDNENLKDLLKRFFGPGQAENVVQEFQKGQQTFGLNPAPEPDESVIADVKREIAARLSRPKTVFRQIWYKAAAVAAVIVILALAGVKFFGVAERESGLQSPGGTAMSRVTWSGWEDAEEPELAILADEIEQVENSILAVRLGENGGGNAAELADMEMELIEIDGLFWKG